MDALMAALVAGLLATFPDRAALIAAASPRGVRTIAMTLLVATAMATASSAVGVILAPRLAPSAQLLMLAAALALIGVEFLIRSLPSGAGGSLSAGLVGSGLWFAVLTLAMRSAFPWLAVPGAVAGVTTVMAAASVAGTDWGRLPLRLIRRAIGIAFVVVAAILACSAIGIV